MSTNFSSSTLNVYNAKRFKDTFAELSEYNTGFIFIGKALEYANTSIIDPISDTTYDEKTIWDNMIALEIVLAGEVELVVPRLNWVSGQIYKQFDDTLELSGLLTSDSGNNTYAMYVMNSENNVYKCVNNNDGAISTSEPIGNYTMVNGFIRTADDYVWKYLYNIKNSNKFLDSEWMPVPGPVDVETTSTDYNMSETTLIDGSLSLIIVTNGGAGYIHTTQNYPFVNNQSYLAVSNTANILSNMAVSGTGILSGTYITSVSTEFNRIYLSYPTIASGNTFDIVTRVVVDGDGTGVATSVSLVDDRVDRIIVDSDGYGYNKANVTVYGSAVSNVATARAVLPLKYGHGYSPFLELLATNVAMVKRIGQVDSTENGVIPTDISFRQYGLLINPHKYHSDIDVSYTTVNSVLSQTTDITLQNGTAYSIGEFVYQGSISAPTFKGYVISQDSTTVKLTNTFGTVDIGSLLKGSSVSRPVIAYVNPALDPYSGNILYVNNISSVERADGQAEEIKFVIKF